ncbi:MAG: LptA/OstA family protein [Paracoccaceae bacterium]
MTSTPPPRALFVALLLAAAPAWGQQDGPSPFGSFKHDAGQPIEITADSLAVDQARQQATFRGEVVAGQGTLRLTAETVVVSYGGDGGGDAATGRIESLRADGDVFLSNGAETARGAWAEYDVSGGVVEMGGDVVLTQGENAISGQTLRIDLNAGAGEISGGRVRSVFTPPVQDGSGSNESDEPGGG